MIYPTVNILILNWNGEDILNQCIESVFTTDYPNFKVTIIDNGSSDNSINHVQKNYKDLKVIKLENNIGYSRGYNFAFNRLKNNDDEYYCLLNNDTLIKSDTISNLINGTRIFGKNNIYCPKILNYYNNHIWYAGGRINKITRTANHIGLNEKDSITEFKSSETDFVSGCAFLINKKIINSLGGFDESYGFYYEDVDLCVRAKEFDVKSIYINNSLVYHKISSSFGGRYSIKKIYYRLRSTVKFLHKHNNIILFSLYIFSNTILLPFTIIKKIIRIIIK